jgi:3-phenylpropionate/trans-cinnamate dioxygenase ferredoxin subunit
MSIDVGAVKEFADGSIHVAECAGRSVGIVHWQGRFHALDNACTHQGGPVCAGILSARLTGSKPGMMDLDEATPVISCPWHGWEFDVRTGQAISDRRHRLRTYGVRVVDGRVLVDLDAGAGG